MTEYRKFKKLQKQNLLNTIISVFKCIYYDMQKHGFNNIIFVISKNIRSIRIRYHLINVIKLQYKIKHHSTILLDDLNYEEFCGLYTEIAQYYHLNDLNYNQIVDFYGLKKEIKDIIN